MRSPTHSHRPKTGWTEAPDQGPEEFFCQLAHLEAEARQGRYPLSRRGAVGAALLGLAGLTAAGALLFSTCTLCYAVSPQGEQPLAFVQREEAYAQAVCRVEEQVSAILDQPYAYPEETQVALTIAPKEAINTPQELTETLMETVDQVRTAYILTVDGRAAGACGAEEDIAAALALVEDHYTTEHTTALTLLGTLAVTEDYFPTDAVILTPEELAAVLLAPPEGEEESTDPFLLVETTEELTYTQAIPSPVTEQETADLILGQTATLTQGTEGQEQRRDRVTYRCGVEVSRETLSAEQITDPTPTVVGIGTAQGVEAARGRFVWPTAGTLTSPFGTRTIFGSTSFHSGIDLANVTGTDILAAADGTVTWAGPKGTYGNLLKVDHGNGFVTYYAHCSQLLVSPGEGVAQGQVIAKMGSTGRSTGPHLHFEVRWQNSPIDPAQCLP